MARTPKAPANTGVKTVAKPDAKPSGESIPAALATTPKPQAAIKRKPAVAKAPAAPATPLAAKAVVPVAKPAPALIEQTPTPIAASPATPDPVPVPVQAPAPVPTAAVPADSAVKEDDIMATKVENAAETATAKGQAVFAEINERAKGAFEKGAHAVEELNAFAKGNIEALVESSKIAAKGAEEIAKYSADYARATVEKANATARQFAGVKSPTEFFQLQSEVAKTTLDALAAEGAKFAENYLKLLGEIAQPLSNRVALAADKVKAAA